jgi:hypothetical protein
MFGTVVLISLLCLGTVGVGLPTARVMTGWGRLALSNRYLMGRWHRESNSTGYPGYDCAEHLLVRPRSPPVLVADWVHLGIAVQRIWLTATH